MTDYSQNNKRIAKNTIFLYVRMVVMMAVSLFTFRELLKQLGVADYGTYNAVGGVVILFSFLSNAMTQSNQRFLSFHIGKGDMDELKRVFSMIVNVQLVISLVIFLLAESIGLWFINSKMNFTHENMVAVNCVYQFTILTFLVQIMQIPYTSAITSHEKMSFFSYFSIGEAIIRLGVVLSLSLFATNRLIIYAGLLTLSAVSIFIVYYIYCKIHINSCNYIRSWDSSIFRRLISFSGWNMLGGLGNVAAGQGINILINIFCGVVVNAAMGVSHQISAAVTSLVSNMQMAFNPQIIKSYAAHDVAYFNALIFRSSRFSFYLIAIVGLPVIVCMKTILGIWLTDIPEYAIQFAQLTIVFCMVDAISGPLWTANQASGKVKNYMIIISCMIFFNLPIAYIILKLGYSPVYVIGTRAGINFAVFIFRLIYLNHSIKFPSLNFFNEILTRDILFLIIAIPIIYYLGTFLGDSVLWQLSYCLLIIIITAVIGFYIMLLPSERNFIIHKISTSLK